MTSERIEVQRTIAADPATIFRLLCDPKGHVAIDSSGMLQDATGGPVTAVGDTFVVHMDRESLNDFPMGRYDVTVHITTFVPDREIAWTIVGTIKPPLGHVYGYRLEPIDNGTLVTSYYDWSSIDPAWKEAGQRSRRPRCETCGETGRRESAPSTRTPHREVMPCRARGSPHRSSRV
jgi:hypothetical protein